ncbi:unnamed protein product [Urochloa humidicola]
MQARAYPACLPGPAGARCGRSGLLSSTGSAGRRTPAGRGRAASVRAVDGASAAAAVAAAADAASLPPPQVTWQIVVGAVAGVTPFVVAGVEFGKRIFAQKKCEVCGGSGLVMKNDYYVRCQGCVGWPCFFRRWFSSMAVLEKVLHRMNAVVLSPLTLIITSWLALLLKMDIGKFVRHKSINFVFQVACH